MGNNKTTVFESKLREEAIDIAVFILEENMKTTCVNMIKEKFLQGIAIVNVSEMTYIDNYIISEAAVRNLSTYTECIVSTITPESINVTVKEILECIQVMYSAKLKKCNGVIRKTYFKEYLQ